MGDESCQITTGWSLIRPRDVALDNFLNLLQSPFKQVFTTHAFLASLGSSLGISLLVLATFCLLRPYNSLVYAPKLRYADEKRAPPAIGKGYFSWMQPLIKCHEADLVDKIGMDATIFLRFGSSGMFDEQMAAALTVQKVYETLQDVVFLSGRIRMRRYDSREREVSWVLSR